MEQTIKQLEQQQASLVEERNREIQDWNKKNKDLEQTVLKFKKIMNLNLTSKDASDKLKSQLREAEEKAETNQEQN